MAAAVAGGWLVPAGVADGAPAPVAGRGYAVVGQFPVRGSGQTQRTDGRAPAAGPDDAGAPPGAALGTSGVDIDGLAQSGTVAVPDVSAAAGPRYLVEAVNSRLASYTRAGTERCELALDTLFGAGVSGPRVL